MTQDDFLQRLWTEVIDAVPRKDDGGLDFALAARLARYEAVFSWCVAFDEEDTPSSAWLSWPSEHRCWATLVNWSADGVRAAAKASNGDAPFADSARALDRLLATRDAGELAARLAVEGFAALAGIRELLPKLEEGAGLHESLLTADPTGREARPGSWPPEAARPRKRKPVAKVAGLLLTLKRAHELALSPDGRFVVAATGGAVTEVDTGKELAKCAVLPNTGHVAWSPDGTLIAATNTAGQIAIFDSKSGKRLQILSCTSECAPPLFSGGVLVAGDWDGHLFAWDAAQGRELAHLELQGTMIHQLQPGPVDGGFVALVSHKPSPVELISLSLELEERAKRLPISAPGHSTFAVAAEQHRALISTWGSLTWLDLRTGAMSKPQAVDEVADVALSPDGNVVIATTGAGFRVGPADDLARGRVHPCEYSSGKASFSADGGRVALATWKGGEVWELDALLARSG